MSLLSKVFGFISGPVEKWQEGRTRIKEAKINAKIAKYTAEAEKWSKALDAETNWDLEALKQSQFSWKDEYLMIVMSLPFICSFIPGAQDYVLKGWEYVGLAPGWYQTAFLGVVAATFGLRWWFNKKLVK